MSFLCNDYASCRIALACLAVALIILLQFGCQYNQDSNKSIPILFSMAREELRFNNSYLPDPPIPTIYIVTPTYSRLIQKAELTRLSTVFQLVGNIHWILVEDSFNETILVAEFLKKSGLNSTHLAVPTPKATKRAKSHRGVQQRNAGLEWLRSNRKSTNFTGVVYFADDDNTYSPELFEEIRYTKKVSVFPVGLVGRLRYESAIVINGKVVGWRSVWHRDSRKFAIDMAGFAVNLKLVIEQKEAKFSLNALPGHLETYFLEHLNVTLDDLEPRAQNCTKVLVWHTKSEPGDIGDEYKILPGENKTSNFSVEI